MKNSILLVAVLVTLVAAPAVWADDVDDLKASVEKAIKAWESGDVGAILDSQHDDAVGFYNGFAFPSDLKAVGKDQSRKNLENFFANNDIVSITLRNNYRVIGDVGFAWGHPTIVVGSSGFLVDVRSTPAPLCSFCGTGIDHCALA